MVWLKAEGIQMIFNIISGSRKRREKRLAQEKPHNWFAWYPVRISSDKVVWLEIVQRQIFVDCGYKQTYYNEVFENK